MPKQFIPGKSVTNSAQQRQGNFALAHKHGNFAGTPSSNLATKQGMNISNLATHNSSTNGSVEATPDPSEQQNKVPKPSATEVANKLLKVLLVSEPLSILDLCKIMPEVPRESVQSVLEVLQVLGLISQSASTKEPTSSRSSSSTNTISLFSMTDYAKFSSPIILADIETEVRKKQESTQNVSSRNEQLQVRVIQFFLLARAKGSKALPFF